MSEQSELCSDAAWTVKKDIFISAEKAVHRTAFQTGARQQRGRFGTETRQNKGEVTSAKAAANDLASAATWRSGWDSNPRAVTRKLISSQPRYDHFDTAAYAVVCTGREDPAAMRLSIMPQPAVKGKQEIMILWVESSRFICYTDCVGKHGIRTHHKPKREGRERDGF